jgi:hypothetical protein
MYVCTIKSQRVFLRGITNSVTKCAAHDLLPQVCVKVDVKSKSISRDHNVILLASGKMAEYAGRKIYRTRSNHFNYVNSKDDAEPTRTEAAFC